MAIGRHAKRLQNPYLPGHDPYQKVWHMQAWCFFDQSIFDAFFGALFLFLT